MGMFDEVRSVSKASQLGPKKKKKEEGAVSKETVRKQVIERDGKWCLLCGKPPKGLHLHRVVYGSQKGKYEKSNCVLLCNIDHDLIHSDKRLFQPLLLQYLELATKHQLDHEPTEPPFYWFDWIWKMRQAKEQKQKHE